MKEKVRKMEEQELLKTNKELAIALVLYKSQFDLAMEGLRSIRDSCDPYQIADKCLFEIDELGQK